MGISSTARIETVWDVAILTPFGQQTFAIPDEFTYKLVLDYEQPVQQFSISEEHIVRVMLYNDRISDVHTISEDLLLRVVLSGAVYREDTTEFASAYGQIPYGTTAYGVGLIYIVSSTLTASARTHRVFE